MFNLFHTILPFFLSPKEFTRDVWPWNRLQKDKT